MSDNDQSLYNLRYNQVTRGMEAFGGGTPTWTPLVLSDGGTPAGGNGDVQFNNAGAFGADPGNLNYNSSTQTLNVSGAVTTGQAEVGNVRFDGSMGHITIEAVTVPAPYLLKLPDAQGTGALTNDGSGNLSWVPSGGGHTANVVQFTDTTPTSIVSTSSAAPTATPLTVTITPGFITSRIKVTVTAPLNWITGGTVWASLLRGSTVLPTNQTFGHIQMASNMGGEVIASITYIDSPATTSATTYTFAAFANGSGNATYAPESEMAVIIAEEIFA